MYLEIDEGFDSHPKTVRLCRVLGDVNAGQYLIRIWAWACRSAPDGDLSGMEAADIEAVARYAPADGKLFAALTDRWSPKFGPWIDSDGSALRLHGWDERQGAAIKRMEKHAARMRDYRACHVARTNGSRSTTDKTSPDKSSQDKGEDTDSAEPACAAPALLTFPCAGDPDEWAMTECHRSSWAEAYPGVDIMAEARRALVWVNANPTKKKTARGMAKFLIGWMGRCQDRAPRAAATSGQAIY